MKNRNAGRVRAQKRFVQSRQTHKNRKQAKKALKELRGHEIISTGRTLQKVGKKVEYKDGFRLGHGSARIREMSAVVADMGERVGESFRRPGKKKTAQLLLGLPDGECLGFCYSAYKHDKRLPSVAMVDATQTAANITYHYESKICGQAQLAALTFPALDGRITVENYKAGVDLAFKRFNKLKNAFKKSELGEFIYAQLEAPFDPETETFYLHFHVFVEIGFGDLSRRNALSFLKANTPWLENHAGLHLKRIAHKDVGRVIRYGTKPCSTAYEIAAAGNESVFEGYLGQSKGKRFTRTEGPLKASLKELKDQGRRTTFHRCETTGRMSVCLVEKRSKTDPKKDDSSEASEAEKPDPERVRESPDRPKTENIYCGSGRPVASPEGRLLAFGLVQNFEEDRLENLLVSGGPGSFYEANKLARNAWETNTGRRFSLKEFLNPIAEDILKALRDSEVQSYTVIVSPNVLKTLLEIEKERKLKSREIKDSPKPKYRWLSLLESPFSSLRISSINIFGSVFWSKVNSFISKMKR